MEFHVTVVAFLSGVKVGAGACNVNCVLQFMKGGHKNAKN